MAFQAVWPSPQMDESRMTEDEFRQAYSDIPARDPSEWTRIDAMSDFVRLDDGRILATPTMTCKGRMTEDLLAITDLDGNALNKRRASSELAMHLLIYRELPEINAVCHAHPPNGTAFAVAGHRHAGVFCRTQQAVDE